ncbi:MAG TPA: hypothetical protein VIF62_24765 [Labilithrix sp.]|jgi:hypothetical protein
MSVSPDQYFDLPEPQRRAIAQDCATRLAPLVRGQLEWGDGDLAVRGTFNGRPARLRVQLSFGTLFVELDFAPGSGPPLPLGMFELHCDPHPGEHRTQDREYFAPNVYSDGLAREMVHNLLHRLPQQAQTALVQTLAQFDRGFFSVDDSALTLFCPAHVTLSPQSVQSVGYYLNLLFMLSNDIALAWREVRM